MIIGLTMFLIFFSLLFFLWIFTNDLDLSNFNKMILRRIVAIIGIGVGWEVLRRIIGFETSIFNLLFRLWPLIVLYFGLKNMWPNDKQNFPLGAFLVVFASLFVTTIFGYYSSYSFSQNVNNIVLNIQRIFWLAVLVYAWVCFVRGGKNRIDNSNEVD